MASILTRKTAVKFLTGMFSVKPRYKFDLEDISVWSDATIIEVANHFHQNAITRYEPEDEAVAPEDGSADLFRPDNERY